MRVLKYIKDCKELVEKGSPKPEEWEFGSVFDFVARKGKAFPEIMPVKKVGRMEKSRCYHNSYLLVTGSNKYRYCEGFARSEFGFITAHAWVIDEENRVLDPTWDDGEEYFGIIFTKFCLLKVINTSGYYSMLETHEALKLFLSGEMKHDQLAEL